MVRRRNRQRLPFAALGVAALLTVLTGCGGGNDGGGDRGVGATRKAGSQLQLTICVTNNTSGTIQGTPALYASKGEGEFRAGPGQRVCVDGAPNYTVVDQRVLSAVGGPGWTMKLTGGVMFGTAYGIEVCGVKARDNRPLDADVDCGGNPYRFSGTVTGDRDANRLQAEYIFADR